MKVVMAKKEVVWVVAYVVWEVVVMTKEKMVEQVVIK